LITILDEIIRPSLTNRTEFGKLIDKSSNDLLSVAHKTVETRLAFANTHLVILRQVNNNTLKRAMFENIIINLVSSLQSVAHVINEHYTVGINYTKVEIDHKYYERKEAPRSLKNIS
jgi:type VI protein secretion system component Hcp